MEKMEFSLKSENNNGYFTWRFVYILSEYLAEFFFEWEMCHTKL
jgi:hypothetical protein